MHDSIIRNSKARLGTTRQYFAGQGWRARVRLAMIAVLVGLAFGTGLIVANNHGAPTSKRTSLASSGAAAAPVKGRGNPETSDVSSGSTRAVKGAQAADGTASPASGTCQLLTPAIARQILGSNAVTEAADAGSPATADMATTACAYSNGAAAKSERWDRIQLVARIALTSLGVSENGVAFGSGRPPHATNVAGYGQAAYWNPPSAELNILAGNNWYTISRQRGSGAASLTDTAAVAQLIAPRLAR